ncbi:MAG: hypothetical protein A2Y76_00565 [Planctomycetes bacterium RBG_13_60_9]|nr:MAG: hypothetical protein A2Y76_00565 [Planctomycetes bacterium RBG_13_60_9]
MGKRTDGDIPKCPSDLAIRGEGSDHRCRCQRLDNECLTRIDKLKDNARCLHVGHRAAHDKGIGL